MPWVILATSACSDEESRRQRRSILVPRTAAWGMLSGGAKKEALHARLRRCRKLNIFSNICSLQCYVWCMFCAHCLQCRDWIAHSTTTVHVQRSRICATITRPVTVLSWKTALTTTKHGPVSSSTEMVHAATVTNAAIHIKNSPTKRGHF